MMKVLEGQATTNLYLFKKEVSEEVFANILKWIEALESGSYKQGKNQLRKYDCFCCLGVANRVCDLGKDGNAISLGEDCKLVGLDSPTGLFYGDSLTHLNDSVGWSFREIANLLRDQLQFVKVVQTV